ncbi:MAG: LPS assembly protein LptD, partial [Gammaproteobacteria bacterium]|nr:LPS assembly protein LptD [Gammaproteobacteria bacterium]
MCEKSSHYAHAFFIVITISMALQSSHADTSEKISSSDSEKPLPVSLDLCPVKNFTATRYIEPRSFAKNNIDNTYISADLTESSDDGTISLDGSVIIEQDAIRITADHADYNKQDNKIRFSGDVHIDTEDIALDTDQGEIIMGEKNATSRSQGTFFNNSFFLPDSNMKGRAEKIFSSDQTEDDPIRVKHTILYNASITSCNLIDPDWLLTADEIYLDHDDEQGSAEDAVMRFKGVPFLYTPYIRFPTSNKRRSGLLFPLIGASSSVGADLAVPWYWNIAPNQDAVLTPHYMAKRGFELGTDYRYLTKSTTGEFAGAYLPNDQITNDDRYQYRYQQHSLIMPNLVFDTDIQNVSDLNYFNDFSSSLASTSQTHLNRSATLNYDLSNWHMRALLQDIKTIDASIAISDRPYERLPQLTLSGNTEIPNSILQFTMQSEYVDFEHQDNTNITGSRLTLTPGLRLPLSGTAWFINPAVKFSHTQYDVGTDGNSTTPGTTVDVDDRNLPISSIDAGLFFERPLSNGYQQTLEPRAYYLYVPHDNQTNTPLFDTSSPDFTVAQLFRDNRFIGGDRIGDANQLTLALTSRILDPNTGTEFLRASIGQILYFED